MVTKQSEPDPTLTKVPSLRAVKTFVAAAKYQSFTGAAKALCVTQAAVSKQIRELETYLGTELFARSGRSVVLTVDGSLFYDAAQLSFINIAQAAERLRLKTPARKTLTVCCSPAFASLWMQHRLPSFLQANRDIELTLIATQNYLSMEAGVLPDVYITKLAKVREGYHSTRLFHDVIYPVCTPQYLQEDGELSTPDDLRNALLLDLSPYGRAQLAEHVDWRVWLALHDVDVSSLARVTHHPFISNDYHSVVQMALMHQGIALGWSHLVGHLVESGALVRPIPHEIVHKDRCHYFSVREDRQDAEACIRFKKWMLAQI